MKDILNQIETSGSLEPIWKNIQDMIRTKLWDEFQEAYGHQDHPHFLGLLDNGQYLPAV